MDMSINDSAMEIEPEAATLAPRPKLSVKVKKFHAVATWKWQTREDTCGICHSSFDGTCVWGECTHVFHMHCILKWISGKNEEEQVCPLCKRPWRMGRLDGVEVTTNRYKFNSTISSLKGLINLSPSSDRIFKMPLMLFEWPISNHVVD